MSVQPCKLFKFTLIIALTQILLAEPLHGCCRQAQTTCPLITPDPEPIPLEQTQLRQIIEAKDRGIIDGLRANKTLTYQNQRPIVTYFTRDQKERILEMYRVFGKENEQLYDTLLWDGDGSEHNTTDPIDRGFQRKRRSASVAPGISICPVNNIMEPLITAFNADDDPLQIIHFHGFNQTVLRQECKNSLSPHGQLFTGLTQTPPVNILCRTVRRSVYLIAIRLDDSVTYADIDVEEVQVESCSSRFI